MNITEKDVGRKVIARDGEVGVITGYNKTAMFPVIVYFDRDGLYGTYTPKGRFLLNADCDHLEDLIGFTDEYDKGYEQFNLEKALAGEPVVTRDGREVSHVMIMKTKLNKKYPVVAVVVDGKVYSYTKQGRYLADGKPSVFDLFMKPKTRMVNGFEVPAPVKTPPQDFDYYYVPSIQDDHFYFRYVWTGSSVSKNCLKRGLVFLTKEDAIANAKAMLGINPYGEEGN